MILAALALALQPSPPRPAADVAIDAAVWAWARCTSERTGSVAVRGPWRRRQAVEAAMRACLAEQEGVRAALVARDGPRLAERMLRAMIRAGRRQLGYQLQPPRPPRPGDPIPPQPFAD